MEVQMEMLQSASKVLGVSSILIIDALPTCILRYMCVEIVVHTAAAEWECRLIGEGGRGAKKEIKTG